MFDSLALNMMSIRSCHHLFVRFLELTGSHAGKLHLVASGGTSDSLHDVQQVPAEKVPRGISNCRRDGEKSTLPANHDE